MILSKLSLTQFRNFQDTTFTFADTVLVVGPNGVGKSNLIEAIRMLSLLKSFKARFDQEAITFGADYFRLSATVKPDISEHKTNNIVVYLGKNEAGLSGGSPRGESGEARKIEKKIKLDNAPKRLTEMIGFVKTVLFTADEIQLVAGSPQKRRHFLDFLLSQLDHGYLYALAHYRQVLRQRNELLNLIKYGHASASDLEVWNAPLIEHGEVLWRKRTELVAFFNDVLPEVLRIEPRLKKLTAAVLAESVGKDIQFAATSIGPHRDDFELIFQGKSLAKYGSRGQWRRAVSLLKVAETEYLFSRSGTRPILLADDLFSELDLNARELIKFRNVDQSIYTTPDLDLVPSAVQKRAQIITL